MVSLPSSYQESRDISQELPHYPKKVTSMQHCVSPLTSFSECVLFQVKDKMPKGLHCNLDPFQEVHFYTRPCSQGTSLAISFTTVTELVFKEFSRVACYYRLLWFDSEAQAHLWNTCSVDGTVFGGCEIFRRCGTADRSRTLGFCFQCYIWFLLFLFCILFHSDMDSLHPALGGQSCPPPWLKPSEVRSHNKSFLPQVVWVMYCYHSDTKVANTQTQFYPLLQLHLLKY